MERRKTHEIILLSHSRVRCLCGWEKEIILDTVIYDAPKNMLLDWYNDHRRDSDRKHGVN